MTDRYARQMILPEVGAAGQARLAAAAVTVIGAGGLGSAVLEYLVAAGVGRVTIVDHDRVEESNLHRQPLYGEADVGAGKAPAAAARLRALNAQVQIEARAERLTPANAASLAAGADVVVDAADSFAVTYALSDACQRAAVPLVSASVLGLSGYVGAFCGGGPSYRAVFPELPGSAGSCAESGVLGTAVGVLGTLEAHLTLALLLKWEPSVLGQLVSLDLRTLRISGFSFAAAPEARGDPLAFIAPEELRGDDVVIDLRSTVEAPESPFPGALRVGVEALERAEVPLPPEPRIVLCCRSGVRAWRAARALQSQGHTNVALIALGG
ncbi:MAG TPA: HesA/MoeB/ThiF family protein [Steroidobacteraceae bacterium]|nr:HesA/MoeB/ThiF family protein [Steroidobacteraceae bacterium]